MKVKLAPLGLIFGQTHSQVKQTTQSVPSPRVQKKRTKNYDICLFLEVSCGGFWYFEIHLEHVLLHPSCQILTNLALCALKGKACVSIQSAHLQYMEFETFFSSQNYHLTTIHKVGWQGEQSSSATTPSHARGGACGPSRPVIGTQPNPAWCLTSPLSLQNKKQTCIKQTSWAYPNQTFERNTNIYAQMCF